MSEYDYDVIVLGSGPAGEAASMNAAKHGMRAAVIENRATVGGGCTHQGTIPSKALRQMVKQYIRDKNNPLFRVNPELQKLTFPDILRFAEDVIRKQVKMRSKFYVRNRIDLFPGHAELVDKHHVNVTYEDGRSEKLSAASFIIATGASPYHPSSIDFSHERIYDSDSILSMRHHPRKIIIYGAGVIGCEYASIFAGLGVKVDLINNRERLLEFLDDEISDALSYHLRDQGVMVRHRESFEKVTASDEGVVLQTKSGKRLHADALLFCNGRSGNTDQIGLDKVGITPDQRGHLPVDHRYQTAVENIYAAGDVIGWPSLASAAYDQGRAAAAAARGKSQTRYVNDVPTGIYTLPEISSVGKTERELTEACIPYEVGRAFFKDTARAQISGEDVGMLKILFHSETLELLGIHCFGAEATEIVHIGQAIMKQVGEGNSLRYFVSTTFNYPTMAEAYRIAALNGLNRLEI